MIVYRKVPQDTPGWLKTSIFLLGGALGTSISVYGLLALYGLSAFLANLFFPKGGFIIDASEAMYLGFTGITAACAATLIGYVAAYMNGLSRKSLPLSRLAWIPALVTTVLVILDATSATFMYPFNAVWMTGAIISLILSVLPWVVLRTPAARKIHVK